VALMPPVAVAIARTVLVVAVPMLKATWPPNFGDTVVGLAYQVVPPSLVMSSIASTPALWRDGATPVGHVTLAGNVSVNADPLVMSKRIRTAQVALGTFAKARVVAWLTVKTKMRDSERSHVVVGPTVGLLNGSRGRAISVSIVSRSAFISTSHGVSPRECLVNPYVGVVVDIRQPVPFVVRSPMIFAAVRRTGGWR
jgi:hypothetical protein